VLVFKEVGYAGGVTVAYRVFPVIQVDCYQEQTRIVHDCLPGGQGEGAKAKATINLDGLLRLLANSTMAAELWIPVGLPRGRRDPKGSRINSDPDLQSTMHFGSFGLAS